VGGKLLPEYLDISGVTVLVSPVERNVRSHKDHLGQKPGKSFHLASSDPVI
jgi:hypothetical protein